MPKVSQIFLMVQMASDCAISRLNFKKFPARP